jgi:cell division transport system ATP-binding protein
LPGQSAYDIAEKYLCFHEEPNLIRLYGVSKGYPSRGPVLQDLDLHVARGEYLILCGASGAGKTTLMRIITAAERPDEGQVMVAGRNLAKLKRSAIPYLRRNIGVIFQDFKLLRESTVIENVALPLRICGIHGRKLRERVDEVLEWVGLNDQPFARCEELSGGEQQRVALARALISDPVILLADEPTGNLDPESTAQVLGLLELARERGLTVVLATHDPQVISAGQADRVLELSQGGFVRREVRSGVWIKRSPDVTREGERELSLIL